uniref:Uncharacterized protein n=1 Tax=Rhizophora mucronata TaxID=61149 RepID=A0A2P2N1X8_RHIMU
MDVEFLTPSNSLKHSCRYILWPFNLFLLLSLSLSF